MPVRCLVLWVSPFLRPALVLGLVLPFVAVLTGCKGANAAGPAKPDLDADPLALLPESAVIVANLDARGMIQAGAGGASVAAIADTLVPLGAEANFVPSRDVDRIAFAEYDLAGSNVIAVMSGRFDTAKIASITKTRTGDPIALGRYLEFATYSVDTVVYVPLTPRTLLAGTGESVRRALDRIQSGKIERAMPPWVIDTLQTPGAEVALAGDFTTHPIANVSVGSVRVPWLTGLRLARVLGDFAPPGLNVAATLTYGDPTQAQAAAEGVHLVAGWLTTLAPLIGGMTVQGLDVKTEASDLQCKFAVDDRTLQTLVSLAPRLLPAHGADSKP